MWYCFLLYGFLLCMYIKHWKMAWLLIDSKLKLCSFIYCAFCGCHFLWIELIFKMRGQNVENHRAIIIILLFYALLFWLHSSELLSEINNFVLLGLFYFWSVLAAFLLTFNFVKFANFPILHFIWQSTFNIKVFLDNCLIRSS